MSNPHLDSFASEDTEARLEKQLAHKVTPLTVELGLQPGLQASRACPPPLFSSATFGLTVDALIFGTSSCFSHLGASGSS